MGILDLSGRGALVVGGGQGMGRATALLLAQAGANPAVVDAERARAESVASEIEALGCKSAALTADVTNREEVQGLIAAADEAVGPLDIVVNIVGGASWAPLRRLAARPCERDELGLVETPPGFGALLLGDALIFLVDGGA